MDVRVLQPAAETCVDEWEEEVPGIRWGYSEVGVADETFRARCEFEMLVWGCNGVAAALRKEEMQGEESDAKAVSTE